MASCLITIGGTTGFVQIDYLDSGSDPRVVIAGPGTLYLEDDGSDYEWTNLSGDADVSSGCISFTEVPTTCYTFGWEVWRTQPAYLPDMKFDAVIVDDVEYEISEISYPVKDAVYLADKINALDEATIKAVAYKDVSSSDKKEHFIILKVRSENIPLLRIKNVDSTHHIYLRGEASDCLPAGYTEVSIIFDGPDT